ncbi:anthranilate synthase component I [Testudinibacter sp. TR-2022]|uniref:anthranilate synthase component I n=1 Tax=Testudinibacter sp. TR-2022 TaxID=2585029 RepID=UPI00111A7A67|nr:anthranilate synthase component I [Testudinibacter sp. TR-2022]TNH04470.1 anthranilate synthase component I [Pasteurellaceae bacterium Phil31]TNH12008.1 anthranilate synthase component I [Testudinibacter sp. TR-2022]TNH12687.1 anthranilate synthase component I [Testudinibacter sp. TR-2022]TNH12796.1 anthranilate synthase component I [Testudinibacter sp. TR-2022]TNH19435.1 anthranilate synthase component I [Testudinibacter sp. TR-2022]
MPYIHITQQAVDYHPDPTAIFATLCQNKTNTLLLESAEIQSKNSLTSLLFINSALKITCQDKSVTFSALTASGKAVLPHIAKTLQGLAESLHTEHDDHLTALFAELDPNLDEDNKLQAATVFDGLRVINQLFSEPESAVYLGGLFAYDLVAGFIPMDNITLQDDQISCPDYCFYLAEQLLRLDHQQQSATLQTFCFSAEQQPHLALSAEKIKQQLCQIQDQLAIQAAPTDIRVNIEDPEFKQIIERLKQHIYVGDVFQIVPSRRFSIECPNPLATYRRLKITNPSPYMFYMHDDDFILFGASPESALKYSQDSRQLEIYPIAGSRPRGFDQQGRIDPELDARLELELRLDKKELAEHLMLVDLARNDVARVCQSGSRQVKELMQVDRYSHIMHLVSRVVGKLRPELDALHAYQACMNMGTLTGAPKIKAMQLIYQFEQQKRHSYGGAVGYLSSDGNFDTCIVIRSAFVQNGIAHIQAGCGEVLDSDPQMEADETRHKARAVINAIVQTNLNNPSQ